MFVVCNEAQATQIFSCYKNVAAFTTTKKKGVEIGGRLIPYETLRERRRERQEADQEDRQNAAQAQGLQLEVRQRRIGHYDAHPYSDQ